MASQMLCVFFVSFIFLGYDALYVKLIVMMCWQIEILKSEFKAIKGHDSRNVRLISAIRHHQTILKLMSDLETVFSPIMLLQFLFTTLTLCFAMFICIQFKEFNIQVSQALLITLQLTAQMFVFCWIGTELSIQAKSVRDAAYECQWHFSALGFMTCILIIITRCNKVFTFTAGKFVNIDLKTMVNIFQETFSYMMVMINLVEVEKYPASNVTLSTHM
ncbi:odorant receptor coreceptor-like [Anabrus simplex]|uniref:odorant receptor coreceptor-like n=1 Tax=Anabrus simplex TaxID=316456 RepID=UPI0035A3B5FD